VENDWLYSEDIAEEDSSKGVLTAELAEQTSLSLIDIKVLDSRGGRLSCLQGTGGSEEV